MHACNMRVLVLETALYYAHLYGAIQNTRRTQMQHSTASCRLPQSSGTKATWSVLCRHSYSQHTLHTGKAQTMCNGSCGSNQQLEQTTAAQLSPARAEANNSHDGCRPTLDKNTRQCCHHGAATTQHFRRVASAPGDLGEKHIMAMVSLRAKLSCVWTAAALAAADVCRKYRTVTAAAPALWVMLSPSRRALLRYRPVLFSS
jgi:hypothetical protein